MLDAQRVLVGVAGGLRVQGADGQGCDGVKRAHATQRANASAFTAAVNTSCASTPSRPGTPRLPISSFKWLFRLISTH